MWEMGSVEGTCERTGTDQKMKTCECAKETRIQEGMNEDKTKIYLSRF